MKIILTTLSLLVFIGSAHAAETVGEKVKSTTNDVKRSVKKTVHKGEEIICEKADKKCLAKKVNNRAEEASDYVKDKADQGKNIVDNDDK